MIKIKVKVRNIDDVMDFTKDMSKMTSDVDRYSVYVSVSAFFKGYRRTCW